MIESGQIPRKSCMESLEGIHIVFVSLIVFLNVISVHCESPATIPFFEARPNNVSFSIGETGILLCSVTGLQDRFVVWRRMSEPNPLTIGDFVYSSDRRISVKREVSKNEWNLVIRNLEKNDAGVYECAVSSREKYKRLVLLRVNGIETKVIRKERPLREIVLSGKNFVSEGSTITLQCNVTGEDYAPDEVDWFINGHMVKPKVMPRITIYNEIDITNRTLYSTLEIRQSKMSDSGVYSCVCRDDYPRTRTAQVHVLYGTETKAIRKERPSKGPVVQNSKIVMSGKHFVSDGSAITLQCNVTGEDYAPEEVDWFINGHMVKLRVMPRITIYNEINITYRTLYSTLEIRHSKMSDSGRYVCRDPYSRTQSAEAREVHVLYEKKSHFDKREYINDVESGSMDILKSEIHMMILMFGLAVSLKQFFGVTL